MQCADNFHSDSTKYKKNVFVTTNMNMNEVLHDIKMLLLMLLGMYDNCMVVMLLFFFF